MHEGTDQKRQEVILVPEVKEMRMLQMKNLLMVLASGDDSMMRSALSWMFGNVTPRNDGKSGNVEEHG